MKSPLRPQRARGAGTEQADANEQGWFVDEMGEEDSHSQEAYPAEQGGWATASVGAVANTVAVIRWTAWVLLVSGPLLGLLALVSQPTVTAAAPPTVLKSHGVQDQAGPAGFAALYVTAYVSAGQGTESSLSPYFPDVRDLTLSAKTGSQEAEQAAAVKVKQISGGYWSVTVAARIHAIGGSKKDGSAGDPGGEPDHPAGGTLRYFQVPVKEAASGALVAVALPAEVSAPDVGAPPELDYGLAAPAQSSDAAVKTLQGFLGAYLTGGSDDVDRYLSPQTHLSLISPAPYRQVQIVQLAEHGTDEPGSNWPAGRALPDRAQRQLLVTVDATGTDAQTRPLTYAIALKARAGRWDISSLDAAPGLKNAPATAGQEGETS
ncbi:MULTISPECIES: conjugal transfer protein [unclassified Streptomyces]|uniref:conjugal transfer protein n=1 Tax=unclassified Streptomyces TaxID=2593676 RepID=UPI002E247599|nr:conjugal transfer protein [Streptomyces sp. NBC_00963]